MTHRLRTACGNLRPGDVLHPTNRTVVAVYLAAAHLPAGKVEVHLRRFGADHVSRHTFGRATMVTVDRPDGRGPLEHPDCPLHSPARAPDDGTDAGYTGSWEHVTGHGAHYGRM